MKYEFQKRKFFAVSYIFTNPNNGSQHPAKMYFPEDKRQQAELFARQNNTRVTTETRKVLTPIQ